MKHDQVEISDVKVEINPNTMTNQMNGPQRQPQFLILGKNQQPKINMSLIEKLS
jgi:hypothetical protein